VDALDRYLLVGLRLGRHIDGFVDAYYGAPELAQRVDAEEPVDPAALADESAALAAELDFSDAHRNVWLRAQLAGCEATALRLAGEPISWAEEVERCYGVRPEPVPDERFAAAHEELDRALPGSGDLAARYQSWLDSQVVPRESLDAAAAAFERELRARTASLFGLPDDESVQLETVQNEPWAGFNYYLGGRRSRVVINTDLPIHALSVPDLVAHEMYPGHHTEHAWKETLLVDEHGKLEETLFLTGTPQAIVSEGIATMALESILGDDENDVVARTFADLGVAYDDAVVPAVRAFRRAIDPLSVNAAHLLNEEGRSHDEVREYLERWGLHTRDRAEKSLEFLTHPTWRAYISSYSSGYELCRAFVAGDTSRYRRLLTEQLTTSDLVPRSS
jgi:hypothetical protein